MKTRYTRRYGPSLALATLGLQASLSGVACSQTTGFNRNGIGSFDYNTTTNWVDGTINGIWDSSLDIPASQTITFGTDTTLTTGLSFQYTGSGNLTLRGTGTSQTLTLGGDILHITGSNSRTINFGSSAANQGLNVDLDGVTRTFTVGSGRSLGFVNAVANGGLVLNGGSINFSGANTYSGNTTINTGAVGFNGNSGSSANSDVTIQTNGSAVTTLGFGSGANGSGITRAKSVTLDGSSSQANNTAILSVSGNSSNNTIETITGNLSVSRGFGIVNLSPNSGKNTRLSAGAFSRAVGSAMLFRGTNLGANTAASQTANSANILFDTIPTALLAGGTGGAGTSTGKILKGAFGDTSTTGNGSGLVTYDSTYGVRLLNTATEYNSTITDQQTQLDNVRIVGDSSLAGVSVTLTGDTTINSLSLVQAAQTGNKDGVLVNSTGADTALKISSGVIFATINNTNSGDELQINTARLHFNDTEAVIFTSGSSSSGASNLSISSGITNASSLTKSGNGVLKITGTTDNTYAGDTIVAGGTLEFNKADGKNAIGGHLVINAGAVSLTTSNQVADNKDITVNGGIMNFAATGVNARNETFRDLIVTGGTVNTGTSSGSDNTTVNMTNATLTGGTLAVTRKSNAVASGTVSVSGGAVITVDRYNTTSSAKTALSVGNGGLAIIQTASGAYTPITLTGGNAAGVKGGELILYGDVSFSGNGSNSNTTAIAAVAATGGGGSGSVLLNGTRGFTIDNGAASKDLTIQAPLADGATTGGLTKLGSGTLALDAANTYTGTTSIQNGTLALGPNGSINQSANIIVGVNTTFDVSEVTGGYTLADGQTLSGTGTVGGAATIIGALAPGNSIGTLNFSSHLVLAGIADFEIDPLASGLNSDRANVTGSITFGGTLNVLHGGSAGDFANGMVFNLFDGATFSNNFSEVNLPTLGDGLSWQDNLLTDGTLAVVPEPGFPFLGGVGMILLLRRRRV